MLCDRVSLFTKVTREPGDTVTSAGLTPEDVIVMRVAFELPLEPEEEDGEVGEPPPQATTTAPMARATPVARANRLVIMPRSSSAAMLCLDPTTLEK
jgi:hypothetical protein